MSGVFRSRQDHGLIGGGYLGEVKNLKKVDIQPGKVEIMEANFSHIIKKDSEGRGWISNWLKSTAPGPGGWAVTGCGNLVAQNKSGGLAGSSY